MTMALTIELPDPVTAALETQARAEGSQPAAIAENAIMALLLEKQPATAIGVAAAVVRGTDAALIKHFRGGRD